MSHAIPEQLQRLDPVLVTDVVRQDQCSATFAIATWQVERLSDKGIMNPDGLFRVFGHGQGDAGIKSWSVVLKVFSQPNHTIEPDNLWYWKREVDAVQSDMFATLPSAIGAPRFYGATPQPGSVLLWMEHVTDAVIGPWQLEHCVLAAHQLGRFNAAYLQRNELPMASWLCRGHARTWAEGLPPHDAWTDPTVRRFFSYSLHKQATRLWTERDRFYAVLDGLPQVFSHFDFQRRNLFLRYQTSGRREVVAVDWAQCGIGPIGGDLYSLVGSSAAMLEWPPVQLGALDHATFSAYVRGLEAGGWQGDVRLARVGYTTWMALQWGMALPAAAAFWFAEPMAARAVRQFGHPVAELAVAWSLLCDFALTCADEARHLMKAMASI